MIEHSMWSVEPEHIWKVEPEHIWKVEPEHIWKVEPEHSMECGVIAQHSGVED